MRNTKKMTFIHKNQYKNFRAKYVVHFLLVLKQNNLVFVIEAKILLFKTAQNFLSILFRLGIEINFDFQKFYNIPKLILRIHELNFTLYFTTAICRKLLLC